MTQPLAEKLKRSGSRWFQALFLIATVLSASATFLAISWSSPTDAVPREVQFLLIANTGLLVILGWFVVSRYLALRGDEGREGGGRLARRLMFLFGLAAIVPAVIVSLFLWATISNGIDTWFGQRVVTLVEETASVARENVSEFSEVLEEEAKLVAVDVNNAAEGYLTDRDRFESYLGIQAYLRNISAAFILDGSGEQTAMAENMAEPGYFRRPALETFASVRDGEVVVSLQEDAGFASALIALDDIDDAYLYLAKPLDMVAISRLRRAEGALSDYRLAEQRSDRLQLLFVVAYFQVVALVVLLSIRLAQEIATRITVPISRLAQAASEVSEGVRGVAVPLPRSDDEVRALSNSFNVMTKQLDERRSDLVAAREMSERRRQFVETLLAELSAGVIRIDKSGVITLANRSAEELLGRRGLTDETLADVAPELAPIVRQTADTGQSVDVSLDLERQKLKRHVRLKVTQDTEDGVVLTLDDATRLINAQRQLAWRDVARRIAHEIRNPLTPIQLSTERLRRRYSDKIGEDDGVFQRCLDTITRQVSDIGRMVQTFSDFARMPKPLIARFELVALLEDISFARRVVSPDILISVKADARPIHMGGDERLLGQAFTNIIKNAAEALEGRPETEDTKGVIDIIVSGIEADRVEITIRDNGPGFPADVREQLLEPYVTGREGGTGLGLAIVNRVIMDHGGSVQLADAKPHKNGAEVKITLPVNLGAESEVVKQVEFAQ
ncbi:MAG: ATP-binding protein [Pseudomonadota bacterium]